jgi:hypothetical protein
MNDDNTRSTATEASGPPGWTFELVEISNGGWECRGADAKGRQVSRQGSDPDGLLAECRTAAAWVDNQVRQSRDIGQR